jgi:hydrogenase maturation protease
MHIIVGLQYDGVNSPTIGLVDYEVNRPSEELACRKGDGRVLFDNTFTFKKTNEL